MQKALFAILCLMIAAAALICSAGCGKTDEPAPADNTAAADNTTAAENTEDEQTEATQPAESETDSANNVLGEGATVFEFKVTGLDGQTRTFEIHTDEKTVGAALLKVGIIAGDNSQYGLYVKTVDGVTLDYEKDKKYWAFYVNGAYASSGVDSTDVKAGEVYEFKAE